MLSSDFLPLLSSGEMKNKTKFPKQAISGFHWKTQKLLIVTSYSRQAMGDSDTELSGTQCGLQETDPEGFQIKLNEPSLDPGSPYMLLVLPELPSKNHKLSRP